MVDAYLNRIATAVPPYDVHQQFIDFVPRLLQEERQCVLFRRMADRAQIDHRYSFLKPPTDSMRLDGDGFYQPGAFPGTKTRMLFYERHALTLAIKALDQLDFAKVKDIVTHLIVTTCTGFYAPGIDAQIVEYYGLNKSVERNILGYMGCNAALNALKLARHIVRSEPSSLVAILNLELCTIHLQETDNIDQLLSYLIFADGAAASLVSAEPIGIELQSFASTILPKSVEQITWHIGDSGFDMILSGQVPTTIAAGLHGSLNKILDGHRSQDIQHWAVHPGGRTVLDAVEKGVGLSTDALNQSRHVLRRFGNMSSATIMFVLHEMLQSSTVGARGCALAFGPGLTAESMLFQMGADRNEA